VLTVKLDGAEKSLAVDTKFYAHLDHGYASTVHKAQGSTVDRTYVLATPHFDRHTAKVALSRHREAATVFYAADNFGGRGGAEDAAEVRPRFTGRAHDYLEPPTDLRRPATVSERFAAAVRRAEAGAERARQSTPASPAPAAPTLAQESTDALSLVERFRARVEISARQQQTEWARERAESLARDRENKRNLELSRGLGLRINRVRIPAKLTGHSAGT
jgi:hypothetical protein